MSSSFFSEHLVKYISFLKNGHVLVLGDIMLDAYIMGEVERISPEAPIPILRIENKMYCLGGAANVAHNIASLGGNVTLIGGIGNDSAGKKLQDMLNVANVNNNLVELHRPTIVKTRILARHQQLLRLDQENNELYSNEEQLAVLSALRRVIDKYQVVVISDYCKGLISEQFMNSLSEVLTDLPSPPKLLVDPKPANIAYYQGVTLLTPNTVETGKCTGLPVRSREEILIAGRTILERLKCEHLLVTLGSEGMAFFTSKQEVWHIPTVAQQVFDVTGAGDTVIATLALALASGGEFLTSCVLANYAAGLVVEQVGAASISPDQLYTALQQLPIPELSRWL